MKIIAVETCEKCPYNQSYSCKQNYRNFKGEDYKKSFPDWCTLVDYKQLIRDID
jgi:hypothetical protein